MQNCLHSPFYCNLDSPTSQKPRLWKRYNALYLSTYLFGLGEYTHKVEVVQTAEYKSFYSVGAEEKRARAAAKGRKMKFIYYAAWLAGDKLQNTTIYTRTVCDRVVQQYGMWRDRGTFSNNYQSTRILFSFYRQSKNYYRTEENRGSSTLFFTIEKKSPKRLNQLG